MNSHTNVVTRKAITRGRTDHFVTYLYSFQFLRLTHRLSSLTISNVTNALRSLMDLKFQCVRNERCYGLQNG